MDLGSGAKEVRWSIFPLWLKGTQSILIHSYQQKITPKYIEISYKMRFLTLNNFCDIRSGDN